MSGRRLIKRGLLWLGCAVGLVIYSPVLLYNKLTGKKGIPFYNG